MIKRNRNASLVRLYVRMHRNEVRFSTAESLEHFITKATICYYLTTSGIQFYTEAWFDKQAGRADIFVLDKGVAIEVLDSEKMESITKKIKVYPCPVRCIKCGVSESEILRLINDL